MKWACGVTTTPARFGDLLPRTLASLRTAGFDRPHIFADDCEECDLPEYTCGLRVTCRTPRISVHGNWLLGLSELFIRDPWCDHYAMFQDDLIAVRGLREYLERNPCPGMGYANLYTFPANQQRATGTGWFRSNQEGMGAVALVFSQEAVRTLLSSRHMVERPLNTKEPERAWRLIDGGVVESMRRNRWTEYCHNPSLVQHTGTVSTIRSSVPKSWAATSFPGEEFDVRTLLGPEPELAVMPPLRAVVTCVGFADYLAVTLAYNRHHFTEVMVVTTPADKETQEVALANGARVHATSAFYFKGAPFAKFRALEEALDALGRGGCLAIQDVDILWPKHAPLRLHPRCLYSPSRRIMREVALPIPPEEQWRRYPLQTPSIWCGYLQIFNAADPVLGRPPWHPIDCPDASKGDRAFQARWPRVRKVRPAWEVLHLGPDGINWKGRRSPRLHTVAGLLPEAAKE